MDLVVTAGKPGDTNGEATLKGRRFRCALGRGGIIIEKREGDGGTPAGAFALRRLLVRADRGAAPSTFLPVSVISASDGWCDAPGDPAYNRPVRLPYAASHERLWREDHLYDLVAVIGHNDDPPADGMGSAIFVHLAHDDYRPTEGCIAFSRNDLELILSTLGPGGHVIVTAPGT
jgi:L,D-peptidoglycan transpeptidase YkuD (ErfK/YbiS/YcfS/YnhG family)